MNNIRFFIALCFCILDIKYTAIAQTLYSQGFEPGDSWGIIQGAPKISNDNGATYTPANQTIRTGSNFWKVNNSVDTLILESKNVVGQNNLKIVVRLSSISVTTANGSETSDSVQIFAIINGNIPSQADITVVGATNSRWGYDATLIGTTSAGIPATFVSPQNGTSTNNYATLEISIPNGSSTVGLMVRAKNNSLNEIWAIDDIELLACPSITLSGPSSGCLGDTLTFTSSASGNWAVSNSNASIVSNPNDTNTVQVVLINGSSTTLIQSVLPNCNFTQNINIFPNPTPPFVGPVSVICQGQSAVLTATSANNTIHWFDTTGANIGTGNTIITPAIQQSGTVTFYTAAQNMNGCFSTRVPVSITVNPSPIKFAISGGTVCGNEDAIISLDGSENNIEYGLYINGTHSGQFSMGNGSTLDFIITNPVQGSTVTIEAVDNNTGCSTFSDTITINIVSAPNNFYTFNVDTLEVCEFETSTFMLSGSQIGVEYYILVSGNFSGVTQMGTGQPLTFSLSNLQDSDIINIYAVDTTTGCYADLLDEIIVKVYPKPEVVISENSGIFTADSTIGTFVWYLNGNIITGQNQSTLDISQAGTGSGTYFLVYTNIWGCSDTSNSINLTISDKFEDWQQYVQVYPNPFQNFLNVTVPFNTSLTVYDLLGEIISQFSLEPGKNTLNLESLPNGVYFMELRHSEQKWVTKLVKY